MQASCFRMCTTDVPYDRLREQHLADGQVLEWTTPAPKAAVKEGR